MPLDARLRAIGKPLLVIFGSQDRVYNASRALKAYAALPTARTALISGAGHSPQVEKPQQTAALILAFAR
jgi:pimeloyl-ACP methyl ester carboxylesterase